jgi:hypothetical protein
MLFHILQPERLLDDGHNIFQLVKAVKARLAIAVSPVKRRGIRVGFKQGENWMRGLDTFYKSVL